MIDFNNSDTDKLYYEVFGQETGLAELLQALRGGSLPLANLSHIFSMHVRRLLTDHADDKETQAFSKYIAEVRDVIYQQGIGHRTDRTIKPGHERAFIKLGVLQGLVSQVGIISFNAMMALTVPSSRRLGATSHARAAVSFMAEKDTPVLRSAIRDEFKLSGADTLQLVSSLTDAGAVECAPNTNRDQIQLTAEGRRIAAWLKTSAPVAA